MFMEFRYLKSYCEKNTQFREELIKILREERKEKLAIARASDDDEAEIYYDEADELEELINYIT